MPKPGWCMWRARNRRIWAMRLKSGAGRRSPAISASMPAKPVFRRCLVQPRQPYIEFWRHSPCIRKRSNITSSGAIRISKPKCGTFSSFTRMSICRMQSGLLVRLLPASSRFRWMKSPACRPLANTAPDLPPVPGKYPKIGRDHEYERLGTCSILAALDLQDGHITARVEDRHRSVEFISLLSDLDARYPPECTIRIILDNHSAHISKETQAFLSTRPNRFQYVLTPKHGSWLNIVETLFGKMARSFLRHIRVQSLDELKARILKGIEEINAAPVVHRWKNFDALAEDL